MRRLGNKLQAYANLLFVIVGFCFVGWAFLTLLWGVLSVIETVEKIKY